VSRIQKYLDRGFDCLHWSSWDSIERNAGDHKGSYGQQQSIFSWNFNTQGKLHTVLFKYLISLLAVLTAANTCQDTFIWQFDLPSASHFMSCVDSAPPAIEPAINYYDDGPELMLDWD